MSIEISAGGVVIKKSGSSYKVLLIKDKNGNWTFPKGKIEENEKFVEAAKREIAEETNIKKVKLLTPLIPIKYYYKFENKIIHKTVHYFLFKSDGKEKLVPQTEEGITDIKWAGFNNAKKIIGYPKTNLPILNDVYTKFIISN